MKKGNSDDVDDDLILIEPLIVSRHCASGTVRISLQLYDVGSIFCLIL